MKKSENNNNNNNNHNHNIKNIVNNNISSNSINNSKHNKNSNNPLISRCTDGGNMSLYSKSTSNFDMLGSYPVFVVDPHVWEVVQGQVGEWTIQKLLA